MSIDRRSFVQSAALAVGGAAAVGAGEAPAQGEVRLAQAPPPAIAPTADCIDPGPFKPSYGYVQANRAFLDTLFGAGGNNVRDQLMGLDNQTALHQAVFDYLGLRLGSNVKVRVVDLEKNLTPNTGGETINPSVHCFYTWILPPTPRGVDIDLQKTEQAYHHVVVYGYGI